MVAMASLCHRPREELCPEYGGAFEQKQQYFTMASFDSKAQFRHHSLREEDGEELVKVPIASCHR